MKRDYKKLQNGSDIRGVALAVDGGEAVNLGREETLRLTWAFALWLSRRTGKDAAQLKISVGHDSRLTAEELKNHVCDALLPMGVRVLDCGLASTPAMFMSTVFGEYDCDGAIMITASHLPLNRNGFKYFSKAGGLEKSDISEIIKAAEEDTACLGGESASSGSVCLGGESASSDAVCPCGKPAADTAAGGKAVKADLMDTYARHLRNKIIEGVLGTAGAGQGHAGQTILAEQAAPAGQAAPAPLAGLKIAVDAGNGAGGFFAREVLEPLGADVTGSRFLEPDGRFPNHAPNPEDSEAMKAICEAVTENGADLGLIFDTDVDRVSAVDSRGREINRNGIVALAAALIAIEHPGTTVVTDSITSDELTEYLQQCLGLKHLRYKRGYRNVINKALKLNEEGTDSQLAIETSGHAAYKENYFLDDGAYLATKIVIKAAQLKKAGAGLEVLLESLKEPKEAMEKRYTVNRADFADYGEEILAELRKWAEGDGRALGASLVEPNYEGVRINFDNDKVKGWCLLRKSLHDPKLPLNVEVTRGTCGEILAYLTEFMKKFDVSY